MDSGDAAQLAAVAGALGAAFVLLAWSRIPLLAGLALLAGAEAGLVYDLSDHGHRISPKLVALGVAALVPMAVGAAVLVRWPTLITPVVLAAAPFRPPLSFGSEHRFYVGVAAAGQLGRLLPLYGVLGAAALALGWSALRGRELRPVHPLVSLPAVAFFALAALSLHWTLDVTFSEDRSRIRKGSGPEIAGIFRRLALTVLEQDTSLKSSIRGKRLQAGWNESILEGIFTGFIEE